jgi:hypothetical protein
VALQDAVQQWATFAQSPARQRLLDLLALVDPAWLALGLQFDTEDVAKMHLLRYLTCTRDGSCPFACHTTSCGAASSTGPAPAHARTAPEDAPPTEAQVRMEATTSQHEEAGEPIASQARRSSFELTAAAAAAAVAGTVFPDAAQPPLQPASNDVNSTPLHETNPLPTEAATTPAVAQPPAGKPLAPEGSPCISVEAARSQHRLHSNVPQLPQPCFDVPSESCHCSANAAANFARALLAWGKQLCDLQQLLEVDRLETLASASSHSLIRAISCQAFAGLTQADVANYGNVFAMKLRGFFNLNLAAPVACVPLPHSVQHAVAAIRDYERKYAERLCRVQAAICASGLRMGEAWTSRHTMATEGVEGAGLAGLLSEFLHGKRDMSEEELWRRCIAARRFALAKAKRRRSALRLFDSSDDGNANVSKVRRHRLPALPSSLCPSGLFLCIADRKACGRSARAWKTTQHGWWSCMQRLESGRSGVPWCKSRKLSERRPWPR